MCIEFRENIKGCLSCSKCSPCHSISSGDFLPTVQQPLLPKLGESKVTWEGACVWCISVPCSSQFWLLFVYVGSGDFSSIWISSSTSFHCKLWGHFSTTVLHRTKGLGGETFTVLSSESHSGLIILALFSLLLQKSKIIKPDRYVYF